MTRSMAQSCQLCKDRKIRCDRSSPRCSNCVKSGNLCAPQIPRLSWPRRADGRRLILCAPGTLRHDGSPHTLGIHFINSADDDLVNAAEDGWEVWERNSPHKHLLKEAPYPIPNPSQQTDDPILISYFYHVSSAALPRLDISKPALRDAMMRMSLNDSTPSAKAVLYSVLCLSSVHCHGDSTQAATFKSQALKAMHVASETNVLDLAQIQQHLAANLLLCRAEVALASRTASLWHMHLSGAMTLLRSASETEILRLLDNDEGITLYQSLNYHEVFSRFSLMYWRGTEEIDHRYRNRVKGYQALRSLNPPLKEIELLEEITEFLIAEEDGLWAPKEKPLLICGLKERVEELYVEGKIDFSGTASEENPVSLGTLKCRSRTHIFRAAVRIFFERAVHHLMGSSTALSEILDDAFALISFNLSNKHVLSIRRIQPLAFFLIGIEARNEKERRMILDIMDCAKQESETRLKDDGKPCPAIGLRKTGMIHATDLTKRVWIRDDLHNPVDLPVDYKTRLEDAISASMMLPPLL